MRPQLNAVLEALDHAVGPLMCLGWNTFKHGNPALS